MWRGWCQTNGNLSDMAGAGRKGEARAIGGTVLCLAY
jgi:hypothetical protein